LGAREIKRSRAWGILLGLLFWAAPLFAQQRPTWVLYDSALVQAPQLQRQLERVGARIRYSSKWLNAVSVDVSPQSINRIKQIRGVTKTQPVATLYAKATPPSSRSLDLTSPQAAGKTEFDSAFYGFNWRAIRQLGIPAAHILGFTANGVRIAIIDTGFEPAHEALSTRRVTAQRDFINNDDIVANQGDERTDSLDQEIHGTWVWSLVGGHRPGTLVGPAFDANFILAKVDVVQAGLEDLAADEDRWVRAVEWADSMGARIINSSIGFRDFTDKQDYQPEELNGDGGPNNAVISTRMADEAARRGILLISAMGFGTALPTSLQAPADADSIIAVGAIDTTGNPAVFRNGLTTARGPTFDGRLKPELVAQGTHLHGARAQNPTGYDADIEGTSLSTALISGGAAIFMQAWPSLSIMAVRNALLLSGSRAEAPDNIFGYGVPNIASAIFFPEGLIAAGITGVNLENVLTTLQPTFTWIAPLRHPSMSALYRLQVATDAAFNNVVYTDTIRDGLSLTVRRPLPPSPRYFWRVVAETFPDVRRVTRPGLPFVMPEWVRLLTLNSPQGSFTSTTRPIFQWEPLAAPAPIGPLVYDLQIINAQTGSVVQTIPNLTIAAVQPTTPLIPNLSYRWRVIARSQIPGAVDTVSSVGVFVVDPTEHPPATLLYQNFPNPFPRPDLGINETQIWFDVTTRTTLELAVYDLRGRLVRRLIPANASCGNVALDPGQYGRGLADPNPCVRTRWDARTEGGELVTRGVYVLRLRAGGVDQIKRILYMPD
jgi:subtilisin family serine protease